MVESQPVPLGELTTNLGYDALCKEERAHFSKIASRFFIKASMTAPGSVTAQGAIIARECNKVDLSYPILLGECLLRNPVRVGELNRMANKVHDGVQKGPRVFIERIEGIIGSDFRVADSFMAFTDRELEYIASEMKGQYLRPGEIDFESENAYYKAAMSLHEEKSLRVL